MSLKEAALAYRGLLNRRLRGEDVSAETMKVMQELIMALKQEQFERQGA